MNVSSVKNLNGEAFSAVQDASLTNVVQTNSGNWNEISAYELASASYLTAHQSLEGYATEQWVGEQGYLTEISIPESANWNAATATVQTNSSTWDNVTNKLDTTAFSDVSSTFLTAHQAISAEEWNSNYETVNTNSGAWGGDALPITGRDGIDLEIDNGTLYIGASALTGQGGNPEVESYVQTNSANIDETVGCVQTNSASWGAVPNETVLWKGRITAAGTTAQLSEPLTAFDKLEFVLQLDNLGNKVETYLASGQTYSFYYSYPFQGSFRHDMAWLQFNDDYRTWQFISANHRAWDTAGNLTQNENNWQWTFYTLKQINGINRKQ